MSASPIRGASVEGMEIWKLTADGVDRFGVRMGGRRARLVSTLEAAQVLLARVVRDARIARAH